ncbi:MAG: NAD(P)-dependent glycerol-3-phosphate dehydrogenase, partial [Akkermansiaceae bacterium]|nr:NAD(P)-dependent glycerol-3-phosphate dehydrogenase [Akkermansiaceae bacterium]
APLSGPPRVLVLGAGSWGSALGSLLVANCRSVTLFGRHEEVNEEINTRHANTRYLPDARLPESLRATSDLAAAAADAELILFVVPSAATREVAADLAAAGISDSAVLVSCAKGIERGTDMRMSQIIAEQFPRNPIAVLSGPNHAEEVSRGLATCAVIGSADEAVAVALQRLCTCPHFRTYTTDDTAGMEIGGAIKNVFALASGGASGLGLGDNATAALVTRGLAEMMRLGCALGGRQETFIGLSGVGDLIVTCYSHHSRNFRAGLALAKGEPREKLGADGMVVEGVVNTESIYEAAKRAGVRTPLIDAVYDILYNGTSPAAALDNLLTRAPRPENE